ncbi:MAG: hypothetical protein M1829_005088 [Trizodia sp. TS-e1964]|nr:MAG: hypothetical protein M1829_005088 [Trizodia sp. TS-e1964]
MADTMRPLSFLPTIKCSNCAVEIDISMMGDHICGSGSPPLPPPVNIPPPESTKSRRKNTLFSLKSKKSISESPSSSTSSASLKPPKLPPPKIDPTAANRPYRLQQLIPTTEKHAKLQGSLTPGSNSSSSPRTPSDGRRSPYFKVAQQAQAAPISPELSNLDCAFPPFPIPKSLPTAPTEQQSSPNPKTNNDQNLLKQPESDYTLAPLSPRIAGNDNVMKKMDAIVPGPFDVGGRWNSRPESPSVKKGHQRRPTMGNSRDLNRMMNPGSVKEHRSRPSTARSDESHRSSVLELISRSISNERLMPGLPANPRPKRPERPDELLFTNTSSMGNNDSWQPTMSPRSQTFPLVNDSRSYASGPSVPLPRRPSEPGSSSQFRRPSTPSSNRSHHMLDGNSERRPGQESSLATQSAPPSRNGTRSDLRLGNAPPVPYPHLAKEFGIGNPYHVPSESQSSSGSEYTSDAKSGSSRSSPPLSALPPISTAKDGELDTLMAGIQTSMDKFQMKDARYEQPQSLPNLPRPAPNVSLALQSPESPMDPAISGGYFNRIPNENTHKPPPPIRRPTQSKGSCRGCGEEIFGKSADITSNSCKSGFKTTTFYVIDNNPYCELHYHKLNNSICQSCDCGIEGQYLETEKKQKFHPACLTCTDCREVLQEDYFEMNDQVYCERDALKIVQQTQFLGGNTGRKNPERRTTRLMMMM